MKLLTSTFLVALSATVLFGGPQNSGAGGTVYQESCAGCHGPDGKAATAMGKKLKAADLTSQDVQKHSDSELAKTISGGMDKMPAFGDKLSEGDIKNVVAYVRELGKK